MKFKNSLVGKIATGVLALGIGLSNYGCSGGSSTPTPNPEPTYKTCNLDADHDGQGDKNSSLDVLKTEACPIGYVENSDDPNDSDWTCYKGAGELVYTKIMPDSKEQLFTYDLETKTETRLTDNTFYDRHARFSPDGKEITFTRAGSGYDKIYKINRQTKSEKLLISKTGDCRYASYSSDGTQIAFAFNNGSDWDIYTANSSDGLNQTPIVIGVSNDTMPFLGKDNKIYFRSNRDGNMESYRINPTNLNLEKITQTTDDEMSFPVPSPDGNYLAEAIGPDGQEDIYLINLNNGTLPLDSSARGPPLTTNHKHNFWVSWSKDGKKLIYHSYDSINDNYEINIMNKDGSNKANPFNDSEKNRFCSDWYMN